MLNNNNVTTSKLISTHACNNEQTNFKLNIGGDDYWIELTSRKTQFTGPALSAPRNRRHKLVYEKLKNELEISFMYNLEQCRNTLALFIFCENW